MRPSASLAIEIYPGADIRAASVHACVIASKLGIDIEFDFNGVRCLASPGGDPVVLAENQQAEQCRESRGPMDRRFANTTLREKGQP